MDKSKLTMLVAPVLGCLSLLFFAVFLFIGPLEWISLDLSFGRLLVWDALLSFLFFIQHSLMIRRGFRSHLARVLPEHYHPAVFALVSSFSLVAVVLLWQPSSFMVLEIHGFVRWVARAVFLTGFTGLIWSSLSLKFFDPFGSKAIRDNRLGRSPLSPKFSIKGPYRWVRHPQYFVVLLLIWTYPDLTLDRLLFNLLWTAWIYIGTLLEEKDLVADFGDDYRQYIQDVPMLIPCRPPKQD